MFPLFKEPGAISNFNNGPISFLALSVGFILAEQGLSFYLSYRQRQVLKKKNPPDELLQAASEVDDIQESKTKDEVTLSKMVLEKFGKGREYNLEKNLFSMISESISTCISSFSLLLGVMPYFLASAKTTSTFLLANAPWLSFIAPSTLSNILFLVFSSILETLISIPFSYYSTFVIEEKHGFNKTTKYIFLTDLIKNFFISNLFSIPIMLTIVYLVKTFGNFFHYFVCGFMMVVSLVMLFIYPNFIMPLFNKFTKLEDEEDKKDLFSKISELAKSLCYPLKKVFVVDGSKRSSHSNAYLFGFWKDKRIVLFDTLFKSAGGENSADDALVCSDDEIIGILAHELGHWSMSHTFKGFIIQQLNILGLMKMFSLFVSSNQTLQIYSDFGFVYSADDFNVLVGLVLFSQLMSPLGTVLTLLMNTLTRKFEFEADAFASGLGKTEELKRGLLKISIANLSAVEVDPLFHAVHHSHPTLLERLKALNAEEKKTD
eukprot:maker-scaffold_11-snap-gene-7.7-mRNA-1 protein AED:0.21 eAED:0.21 QI:91/1/1/1/1/1/3/35/488